MKSKVLKKNVLTIPTGWNSVDVIPQTISEDGYYSLRPWQNNCHNQLTNKRLRIINAPTGSGKSHMMTCFSAEDQYDNPKLRTIIAVPQTVIAAGFKDQKVLLPNGKKFHWIAGNDLCNDNPTSGTTKALIRFIEGPNGTYSDRIALCTHATLLAVYKALKKSDRLHILKNLNVWLDEAHHLMNMDLEGVPDATLSNGIGEAIAQLLKIKSNNVGLSTASFFRGDRCSLLTEKQEGDFTRFNLPYDEYLKTMRNMKSFSVNFVLSVDWIEAISEVVAEKRCKDIVYLPSRLSTSATDDKHEEVHLITECYRKLHGGDRRDIGSLVAVGSRETPFTILDLVDEDCRKEKKEFINSLKKRPSEDLDAIIALGMFKEGADWVHANRGIVIGARKSLVEMLQIIGRFFRDTPGKEHVEINILLPFSIDQIEDEEEMENNLNSYLKAVYSCLILENIFDPVRIKIPESTKGASASGMARQNYLSQMLPDASRQVSLIHDVGNELINISADAKESGKTICIWDEYEKVINDILTDHGIDSHQEEVAKEIWTILSRKSLKMKGISVDLIDFDILKGVDPVDSIFDYTSGICGIDTFQKLRDALQLAKNFVSYDEAKEIIKKLGIGSQLDYNNRARNKELIQHKLPAAAEAYYKRLGSWLGWYDFLSKVHPNSNKFTYKELQEYCKLNSIDSRSKFEKHRKDDKCSALVPKSIEWFYRKTGEWKGWDHLFCRHSRYDKLNFEETIKFLKPLNIRGQAHFYKMKLENKLPENISGDPSNFFSDEWKGWQHFLSKDKKKITPADKKKQKFIEDAKAGEPAPNRKTDRKKYRTLYSRYTNKKDESYDPIFDVQIRELRPDWFDNET